MKEANIYFSCKSESSCAAVEDEVMTCALEFVISQAPGIQVLLAGQKHSVTDMPIIVKNEGLFPRKLSVSAKLVHAGVLELQADNSICFCLSITDHGVSRTRGSCPELPSGEAAFHCLQREPGALVWPG